MAVNGAKNIPQNRREKLATDAAGVLVSQQSMRHPSAAEQRPVVFIILFLCDTYELYTKNQSDSRGTPVFRL
jgi:hypothetical protein